MCFKCILIVLNGSDNLVGHFNFTVDRNDNILLGYISEVIDYQKEIRIHIGQYVYIIRGIFRAMGFWREEDTADEFLPLPHTDKNFGLCCFKDIQQFISYRVIQIIGNKFRFRKNNIILTEQIFKTSEVSTQCIMMLKIRIDCL